MAMSDLEAKLASLKPVLESAKRSIEIVSTNDQKIVFKLSGFCGGCGCVSSYKDGLADLVAEHCSEFAEVEFIEE